MYRIFFLLLAAMAAACSPATDDNRQPAEKYRPLFHFTPEKNWTNDPNGLVYYEGEYHLFYQYNPYGTTWGRMSWGHAVSKDLMKWEHLPVALSEYLDPTTGDSTMIFSGTVVVDKNTSGLCSGKDCLVAIYTSNLHKDNQGLRQHQSLAYSNDRGRSWKRYDKNPILDIQRRDFRDPKVFWFEPEKKWVMALVIPDLFKVRFYESKNLLEWAQLSEFGPAGDTTRIWECPDLYPLAVENQPGKTHWVLSLSGGHPQGPKFVGMQYFTGQFDGKNFTPDNPQPAARYIDFGKDFYAGIVFNNIPPEDGRTLMLGWVNNWTYANQIPTTTWRGAMSIPRELSLSKTETGFQLTARPLSTLSSLRLDPVHAKSWSADAGVIELEFDPTAYEEVGLRLFKSGDEETVLGYRTGEQQLYLDRRKSGVVDFSPDFASVETAALPPHQGKIRLQVFVDRSIVEVFANDGQVTICDYVFPGGEAVKIESFALGGDAPAFTAWPIRRP